MRVCTNRTLGINKAHSAPVPRYNKAHRAINQIVNVARIINGVLPIWCRDMTSLVTRKVQTQHSKHWSFPSSLVCCICVFWLCRSSGVSQTACLSEWDCSPYRLHYVESCARQVQGDSSLFNHNKQHSKPSTLSHKYITIVTACRRML
jgi:hypothetical protein